MDDDLKCVGCEERCFYKTSLECMKEHEQKQIYYIWPDRNSFLRKGLCEIIGNSVSLKGPQPIVFVDFSYGNLSKFIRSDWMYQFVDTKLILLSDRKLFYLANYWLYHDSDAIIGGVLYHNESYCDLIKKISNIFKGQSLLSARKMPRLTTNEFRILQQLSKGISPKRLAMQYDYSVNTIYSLKYNIERKLGIRIRSIYNTVKKMGDDSN